MPFTTRPASTSRQAMILLASRYGVPGKPAAPGWRGSGLSGWKPGFGLLGWSGSEGIKVLQNFQSRCSGFFRMKLDTKDVVAFDRGRKRSAVLRACHRTLYHRRAKRVRVVDKRTALNPA